MKIKDSIIGNLDKIMVMFLIISSIMLIFYTIENPPVLNTLNETEEKQLEELTNKQIKGIEIPLVFNLLLIIIGILLFFLRSGCLLCFGCSESLVPLLGLGLIIFSIILLILGA